jgi:hypothetical protein
VRRVTAVATARVRRATAVATALARRVTAVATALVRRVMAIATALARRVTVVATALARRVTAVATASAAKVWTAAVRTPLPEGLEGRGSGSESRPAAPRSLDPVAFRIRGSRDRDVRGVSSAPVAPTARTLSPAAPTGGGS